MNIIRVGIFLSILTSHVVLAENTHDFSSQDIPQLPSANIIQFTDGRDYFSYEEPIQFPTRKDKKIPILFFFDYDCRVCSIAHDIVFLYSQINQDKVILEEHPVATNENSLSAKIYLSLTKMNEHNISDLLLFETAEKKRYVELSHLNNLLEWLKQKHVDPKIFNRLFYSSDIKSQLKDEIQRTENYGVFTYPYVIINGKYVLTASTLYNDDYSFAVLDFLLNKIQQQEIKE